MKQDRMTVKHQLVLKRIININEILHNLPDYGLSFSQEMLVW